MKANRISAKTLRRFWDTEKKAERLPATPRPHFVAFAAPVIVVGVEEAEADIADLDDAPIASAWGLSITAGDPLLAALREHHSDIDKPECHIAPELLRAAAVRSAEKGKQ